MKMPTLGVIAAILLILLGVAGYVFASLNLEEGESASPTALIPAFVGLPVLIFSLIGYKKLKLGMHGAALFGLLGTLASLGGLARLLSQGDFTLNLPAISTAAMLLICALFLGFCIKYFIDVRRKKST